MIYRAYCDPYNHPARYARLDFAQSWKRTGGWALEKVLVLHYGPFLKERGVNLFTDGATKQRVVNTLNLEGRVEADKIDVVLTGEVPPSERKGHQRGSLHHRRDGQKFFGVVHVKASFAERRTGDEPLTTKLMRAGYTSPLWTMDCKSTPS